MSQRKRILILIDWFLPGYKAGGPIQSCANLIDHLSPDFDFYVITRDTDYCEIVPYSTINSNEWNELNPQLKVYYISNDNLKYGLIKKLLNETSFDHIYINGPFSLYFSIIPLFVLKQMGNTSVVLATRGMLAPGALALKPHKKKLFLFLGKFLGLFKHLVFHATSNAEVEDTKAIFGENIKVKIAGNLAKKITCANWKPREKKVGILKLINIARIAPEKNLLQALKILKQVKSNITFDFYGPIYDQTYWAECTEVINTLPENIVVNYKGVTESKNVAPLLASHHAMLMPTLGENFGHIILESLQAGCLLIISDQTPWKNLCEKKIGWDISLTDEEKYLQAIESISQMDADEFNTHSKAAFNYAQSFTDDKNLLQSNKNLFS